jgi:LmbE family N-acetylglucosaminyl deacetylase
MKLDILAFGAHPDDVELGCSGTIAKEISLGKKVGIVDLTRGELGTRGSVAIRNAESKKATQILGVAVRIYFPYRGQYGDPEWHCTIQFRVGIFESFQ